MAEMEFTIFWSEDEREIADALEPLSRTNLEGLGAGQLAEILDYMARLLRTAGRPRNSARHVTIPGVPRLSEMATGTLCSNMCSSRVGP